MIALFILNVGTMKRKHTSFPKFFILVILAMNILINSLQATPSTIVWIPAVDFQKFAKLHLGIDNYIRSQNVNGIHGAGIYDLGLTMGVLPFKKLQAEVGVDFLSMGDRVYDDHPLYFNLKVGTAEDSLFKGCPAIAIGAYNFGTKSNLTNYNIFYGLIAKTIPVIGRISVGYYMGNAAVLVDDVGNKAANGLLLSWDKNITDKLWLAVDYQGGKNYLGALNFGFSWAFSDKVSVIFGYDIYNNSKAMYNSFNTNAQSFTTQLDINF